MYKIALLAALLPTGIFANNAGLAYGTPAGCAVHLDQPAPAGDGVVLWVFSQDMLIFHETTCLVNESSMNGFGEVTLQTTCSGEGEIWDQLYKLGVTNDPKEYILASVDYPDVTTKLVQCE